MEEENKEFISKKDEYFKKWSEQLNIDIPEFEEEYNNYVDKLKESRKDLSAEDLEKKGLWFVNRRYSLQFNSSAKNFTCFIIGQSDGYDPDKTAREKAIKEGHVNEKGKPIYLDESPNFSWRNKRTIPNADADESFQRVLTGVFKTDEMKNYKLGTFYLKGRKLNEVLPDKFVEYKVRAGCKNTDADALYLNTAKVTRFERTGMQEIDFDKMSKKLLTKNKVDLNNLEKVDASELPLGVFLTEGTVVNINMTNEISASGKPIRSNAIELSVTPKNLDDISKIDTEGEGTTTIWVSKEEPINFGVGSEVMVLGRKFGVDKPSFNATGIFVKYNTMPENAPQKITKENGSAEKEEKGWGTDE